MPKRQSWYTCAYSKSNLDIDHEEINETRFLPGLLKTIFKDEPEDSCRKLLDENKIPSEYYCTHPEIVELGVYRLVNIPKKYEGFEKLARLFKLNLDYEDLGFLHEEEGLAEGIKKEFVNYKLRMCAHCKFYEEESQNK